ncbi:hypothetical protein Mal64_34620 [Pseudobythopirellula maris]|uniref:DUF4268 domain-containing protein n=1 Tax=Pseudobythopirellula maris TaxID=2527991 RepID=A0A5C5ZJL0_9BACT|nr:DUF4268 domain-containing protein [Pseudobythopirellula maris]TWT86633.1 hypothetical protein Mal64_34620 [Pseudobythopirellula maris]
MPDYPLGRLDKIEARNIWVDEARDFTPWLASEENIGLLGDAIGYELEVVAQEKSVGPFKADILCRETLNGQYVLIENQLEKTDHGHLGQLLTYAAGLHAVTVVWVAVRFTNEHRAALDWLNEITAEEFRFFGLEIELWRIGESPCAPKLNIVCKPNDWTAEVGRSARASSEEELSDTKRLQLEYWTKFWDYVRTSDSELRGTRALPQHWNNLPIGRTGFRLVAIMNTQSGYIQVEIYCHDDNALQHFHQLLESQSEIEAELGHELDWQELPGRQASRIAYARSVVSFSDRSLWPEQHEWLRTHLEAFDRVFRKRIRGLNANDFEAEDGDAEESAEKTP